MQTIQLQMGEEQERGQEVWRPEQEASKRREGEGQHGETAAHLFLTGGRELRGGNMETSQGRERRRTHQ